MKIACDIDEVVVEYLRGFCDWYNDLTGGNLVHGDFNTFSFRDTLCVNTFESGVVRNGYAESDYFDRMDLVPGAREGIEILAGTHDVDFVTARPDSTRVKTLDYFRRVFPGRDFNIYFEHTCKIKKLEELEADLIIEDSADSQRYAGAGFNVALLDRKWNVGVSHPRIYRCADWSDILDVVEGLENV
jgi:5'(3')-deoxyribonucleotidase